MNFTTGQVRIYDEQRHFSENSSLSNNNSNRNHITFNDLKLVSVVPNLKLNNVVTKNAEDLRLERQRQRELELIRQRELRIINQRKIELKRQRCIKLRHQNEVKLKRQRENTLKHQREVQLKRQRELELKHQRDRELMLQRFKTYNRTRNPLENSTPHFSWKSTPQSGFTHERKNNYVGPNYQVPSKRKSFKTLNYTMFNNDRNFYDVATNMPPRYTQHNTFLANNDYYYINSSDQTKGIVVSYTPKKDQNFIPGAPYNPRFTVIYSNPNSSFTPFFPTTTEKQVINTDITRKNSRNIPNISVYDFMKRRIDNQPQLNTKQYNLTELEIPNKRLSIHNRFYLTWDVKLDGLNEKLHDVLLDMITFAAAIWSSISCLEITRARPKQSPAIHISFEHRIHNDNNDFDGPGRVLGHTFYPSQNKLDYMNSYIHFDIEDFNLMADEINENGRIKTLTKITFMHVVLHEMGHALGIKHRQNSSCVLYAFVGNYQAIAQLCKEEINVLRRIYGYCQDNYDFVDYNMMYSMDDVNDNYVHLVQFNETTKKLNIIEVIKQNKIFSSLIKNETLRVMHESLDKIYTFSKNQMCIHEKTDITNNMCQSLQFWNLSNETNFDIIGAVEIHKTLNDFPIMLLFTPEYVYSFYVTTFGTLYPLKRNLFEYWFHGIDTTQKIFRVIGGNDKIFVLYKNNMGQLFEPIFKNKSYFYKATYNYSIERNTNTY